MKKYAIVIKNHPVSEKAFQNLQKSIQQEIYRFDAITPDNLDETMSILNLKWNYPWDNPVLDIASGLKKYPYQVRNEKAKLAKISCAVSHYVLWSMTAALNEPILVLEHDAIFTRNMDINPNTIPYDIVGINDPRGATRRSLDFHQKVQSEPGPFVKVPWIDDLQVPQGLAGNSAYIVKPQGAKTLTDLVKEYGLWPNDAIMCRQLAPNMGVTKKYYTKIQKTESTTT